MFRLLQWTLGAALAAGAFGAATHRPTPPAATPAPAPAKHDVSCGGGGDGLVAFDVGPEPGDRDGSGRTIDATFQLTNEEDHPVRVTLTTAFVDDLGAPVGRQPEPVSDTLDAGKSWSGIALRTPEELPDGSYQVRVKLTATDGDTELELEGPLFLRADRGTVTVLAGDKWMDGSRAGEEEEVLR